MSDSIEAGRARARLKLSAIAYVNSRSGIDANVDVIAAALNLLCDAAENYRQVLTNQVNSQDASVDASGAALEVRRAQLHHCLNSRGLDPRLDRSGSIIHAICGKRLVRGRLYAQRDTWHGLMTFRRAFQVIDAGSIDTGPDNILSGILGMRNAILGVNVTLCSECCRLAPLTEENRVVSADRRRQKFTEVDIETARGDAVACLDAWEGGHGFLESDPTRMTKIDTTVVLTYAVAAHRIANPKSPGSGLWISRRVGHIHCRFCAARLESAAQLKKDHDHLVRCALRYLIGMEPEEQANATRFQEDT